jgi:hypothetical protein
VYPVLEKQKEKEEKRKRRRRGKETRRNIKSSGQCVSGYV